MVGLLSKVSKSVELQALLNCGSLMRTIEGDRRVRAMTIMIANRRPYVGVYFRFKATQCWVEIRDKERALRYVQALVHVMSTSDGEHLSELEKLLFRRSCSSRVKPMDVDFLTYMEALPSAAFSLKQTGFRYTERTKVNKGPFIAFDIEE